MTGVFFGSTNLGLVSSNYHRLWVESGARRLQDADRLFFASFKFFFTILNTSGPLGPSITKGTVEMGSIWYFSARVSAVERVDTCWENATASAFAMYQDVRLEVIATTFGPHNHEK